MFVAKKVVVVAAFNVVVPDTVSAFATARLPKPSMVVVAVAPKYARYAEKSVEEAFVNVWSAVQLLAFPVLRESVPALPPTRNPRVPEYASDPPTVAVVVATDWYTLFPP